MLKLYLCIMQVRKKFGTSCSRCKVRKVSCSYLQAQVVTHVVTSALIYATGHLWQPVTVCSRVHSCKGGILGMQVGLRGFLCNVGGILSNEARWNCFWPVSALKQFTLTIWCALWNSYCLEAFLVSNSFNWTSVRMPKRDKTFTKTRLLRWTAKRDYADT